MSEYKEIEVEYDNGEDLKGFSWPNGNYTHSWTNAVKEMNKLQAQIKELEKLYKYGEPDFWRKQNQSSFAIAPKEDIESRIDTKYHANFAGKLAREVKRNVEKL